MVKYGWKTDNDMCIAMIFDNIIGPARSITWVFRFWPVLAMAFIGSLIATLLCKKIALKFGIVDRPDNIVKTHKEPIAYLGGIGILIGLTIGILTGIGCFKNGEHPGSVYKWLLGILAGGTVACFVGVIDDIFEITPGKKFLGQIFAAIILILVGILPNLGFLSLVFDFTIPRSLELILEILIVVFFVLGATNSLNLLDGLDGLCAGVTAIITIAMLFIAIHLATWNASEVGDPVRIIICLALVGGVCGFLPFNRYPAKIFMGDAGSMLLGFMIAALMILFAEGIPRWWMASVVIFGLPILDTAVALARRSLNHRPLFVSDRGHIYDQMIDRGIPLKKTVVISYFLTAFYAVFGVGIGITTAIRTKYAIFVYAGLFLFSALVIWKKGYLKMEGLHGAVRKKD